MSKKLKTILIIIGVILLVGFMMFGKIIAEYNRVIAMDENVKGKWAQVENQLKRRYDLIPNLVEAVKGYAKHEKELFENIAQARTQYFQAKDVKNKIKASNQLEGVLSRLLLLQERYPVLKANESFLKLQDSLEGTENRIAVERKRYNESVQLLNTYIRTFFGRFYAMFAGVSKAEYYEVPEAEQAVPKVKFQ
ncbi:MAG: LemA family protein [Deltaproteobacteria bacterium]|nr:LemA family protein [Deltaproteobacteria bacterium]MBW1969716.1 LemA family protein [Deltaproteobacteria bacterium]MBW2197556.1 LemA family protein [Deltaproteobacteria bacterium]